MAEIILSDGRVALVDDEDFQWLSRWEWFPVEGGSSGLVYARRSKRIADGALMHNVILPVPKGLLPDHRNGNGLDNRRRNLRRATFSQNAMNKRIAAGESGFRGVARKRDRWMAKIRVAYRHIYLGYFDTPIEAAHAYDRAAREHHGEFAVLNFPEEAAA